MVVSSSMQPCAPCARVIRAFSCSESFLPQCLTLVVLFTYLLCHTGVSHIIHQPLCRTPTYLCVVSHTYLPLCPTPIHVLFKYKDIRVGWNYRQLTGDHFLLLCARTPPLPMRAKSPPPLHIHLVLLCTHTSSSARAPSHARTPFLHVHPPLLCLCTHAFFSSSRTPFSSSSRTPLYTRFFLLFTHCLVRCILAHLNTGLFP